MVVVVVVKLTSFREQLLTNFGVGAKVDFGRDRSQSKESDDGSELHVGWPKRCCRVCSDATKKMQRVEMELNDRSNSSTTVVDVASSPALPFT